jgi:DNA-binding MarR family transcriptional regulator
MSGLLEAWDWFDDGLQSLVTNAGYRPLNRSQSLMMLYILMGVQRPIEIARRMRLSRQAIRHMANQLIARGILVSEDDPSDGRSVILKYDTKSSEMRGVARAAIEDLEDALRTRLGARTFQALKSALEEDWGPVVKTASDLPEGSRVAAHMKAHPQPAKKRPPKRKKMP